MKKHFLLLILICMALSLVACNKNHNDNASDAGKLKVSVTFNALYEFTSAVGQDKVKISTIIPAGTEPHDFEPKAADIAQLSDAAVFIYNGLGMETWVDDAVKAADNENLTVVAASDGATAIKNTDKDAQEEHGAYDPHLWLSIKGAETEVQNIADGLSFADPNNKTFYQNNASSYIGKLEALYKEYHDKFEALRNKNIVTGHAAFNYFCRDFGLTQNSVEDVFAEGEPSTRQLASLVDYCKQNHVTTVFAEKMTSTEISQTLANEVGAKVETIYTMESPEDKLSYLDRIKSNCEKIYESLSK